jgi:hypothetical protein
MRIQYDLEEWSYRIVGPDGQEGEVAEIGTPAFLAHGGQLYTALLDFDEGGLPEDQDCEVEPAVYLVGAKQPTRLEEVEFDFEGEAAPEGGEGGGGGGNEAA